MLFPVSAVVVGLILLVFSADHFVTASAALARRLGMSALLVGMIIVGFGTSAPELLVSAMSTLQGAYGIAVGNAWGSNIANIALILGVTAVISPIAVHSRVIRRELPILFVVTVLAAIQAYDSRIARWEGVALLFVFLGILGWSIRENRRSGDDPFAAEVELLVNAGGVSAPPDSPGTGMGAQSSTTTTILRIIVSLAILVGASRLLVWGAVEIARAMGISDLIIGLTVIAVGTSLPELASSIAAARKGENDIALGNIIGSNLFNTTVVVGISAVITPLTFERVALVRDIPLMVVLTVALFVVAVGIRGRAGRINRLEGALLVTGWVTYTAFLALQSL